MHHIHYYATEKRAWFFIVFHGTMVIFFMSKPGRTIGEFDGICLRTTEWVYQKGHILYGGNVCGDERMAPMDAPRRELSIRAKITKNGFLHQNL